MKDCLCARELAQTTGIDLPDRLTDGEASCSLSVVPALLNGLERCQESEQGEI